MSLNTPPIHVVGAGLAGSECAFQLAELGYKVHLYEMKAHKKSPAHKTENFAELVCSNSFGSTTDYSASGQLKWEAKNLNSLILKAALDAAVPAGMALGVDRDVFSQSITTAIKNHPNITCVDQVIQDVNELDGLRIMATGPLTDSALAQSLATHFDAGSLYFYDAIAPIIETDSIDMDICWKADRWGKGGGSLADTKTHSDHGVHDLSENTNNHDDNNSSEDNSPTSDDTNRGGDYINCPLNKEQYYALIQAIKAARKVEAKEFEKTPYFENCMPIEEIVARGDETLRFGPLSFKGLPYPKTGRNCYAVVQLRQDNLQGTAYNMVGFQTKMAYADQKEVFRMIPGLENASFVKLGSIHRNMYINSPRLLNPNLSSKKDPNLFFAGQITGVEGYFDSTCIGLLVSRFVDQKLRGQNLNPPPRTSALGSLLNFLQEPKDNFQPMNINFSLLPKLDESILGKMKKSERKRAKKDKQLAIAKTDFLNWITQTQHQQKTMV